MPFAIPDSVDNHFERELLETLQSLLDDGSVQYEPDSGCYFEAVDAQWPIVCGRIDWSSVPDAACLPPPPERAYGNIDMTRHIPSIRFFLEERLRAVHAGSDPVVVVVGDGALDGALRMPLRLFLDRLCDVLTIPQHTYVVPAEGCWCFNYTFEDEAFFGATPPLRARES